MAEGWAVGMPPPPLPLWAVDAGLDWRSIATLIAVAAGQVAYWVVRAPTELAKTRAQMSLLACGASGAGNGGAGNDVGGGEGGGGHGGGTVGGNVGGAGDTNDAEGLEDECAVEEAGVERGAFKRLLDTAGGVLAAYPVLALTDLPVVIVRVYLFLLLRSNADLLAWLALPAATGAGTTATGAATAAGAVAVRAATAGTVATGGGTVAVGALASSSQLGTDLILYTAASLVANGLTTPLEVVRTRLLLQRTGDAATTGYGGILDALVTIGREEGIGGLWRGFRFRLLWNGLWLGVVLGVQRFYYVDAQKYFLGVIDDTANLVGLSLDELVRYVIGG